MATGSVPAAPPTQQRTKVATAAAVAAAAGGIAWATYNLIYVLTHHLRLPYWDHWDWLERYYTAGLWAALTTQSNEHKQFFPGFAFALDQAAGGQAHLLTVLLLAAQLVTFFLLWRPLWKSKIIPRPVSIIMGGVTAVLATWFLQAEILFWPINFHTAFATMLCLLAITLLAEFQQDYRSTAARYTLAAFVCAFVATFSFGHGMLVWPVLIIVCLIRGPRQLAVTFSAGMLFSLAVYLFSYTAPPHHASPLESLKERPAAALLYFAIYLARPFLAPDHEALSSNDTSAGKLIAIVALVGFVFLALRYVTRRDQQPALDVYIPTMLLVLASGAITALSRSIFPIQQALASRYTTLELLFWYSLIASFLLLIYERKWLWPLLPAAVVTAIIAATVWTYPTHQWARNFWTIKRQVLEQEAASLYVDAFDTSRWTREAFPIIPSGAIEAMRRLGRAPFNTREAQLVGRNISSFRAASGCQGYIDELRPTEDNRGTFVRGWGWGPNGAPAEVITLTDAGGKIVGWGETGLFRPDVANLFSNSSREKSGWIAYGPSVPTLHVYALSDDLSSACPIGQH